MAPACAQDIVANGGFAADLAGWDTQGSSNIVAQWVAVDAGGSPNSGAAQVANSHPTASQGVTLKQCHPAVPGHTYRLGGKVRVPSGAGQSLANTAVLSLRFADDPACSVFSLGSVTFPPSPASFDTWITRGPFDRVAPASAQSVQVRLLVSKGPAGGSFTGQFDDVYLIPQDLLFGSGFQ
jgi:hypothetical protein